MNLDIREKQSLVYILCISDKTAGIIKLEDVSIFQETL